MVGGFLEVVRNSPHGSYCGWKNVAPPGVRFPSSTEDFKELCKGCLQCYLGSQEGTYQQGTHLPVIMMALSAYGSLRVLQLTELQLEWSEESFTSIAARSRMPQ